MQKLAALIISIYVATLLYSNVFFVKKLVIADSGAAPFWNHLGIFLILLVPTFFIVSRIVVLSYARGVMMPLRAILFSLALLGLVLSIFYHIIPLEVVYDLPSQVDKIFASDKAFTIWLIAPLLTLLI